MTLFSSTSQIYENTDLSPYRKFIYALRAPESKRQYPKRLQVFLDYLKTDGFEYIENLVSKLDNRFRYALEFRESSWFSDKVFGFLKENSMSLVWSVRDELKTPPIVTSNQIYIRFIGDRSINEKDFGKIIKDREKETKEYVDHIKRTRQDDANEQHHQLVIAFNNHFAGFGPQSANEFLRLINKPEVDWKGASQQKQQQDSSASLDSKTQQHHQQQQQTSISDFKHY
jgi:uncharacterized protein YecE (DUF72 family)